MPCGRCRSCGTFVGSPENILGSTDTKHGEIAEQVHVGVRRALDVLYGRAPAATFDGVPRTGPVDYRVDSVEIQSKYYNGLRNTLEGVAKHAERYPELRRHSHPLPHPPPTCIGSWTSYTEPERSRVCPAAK